MPYLVNTQRRWPALEMVENDVNCKLGAERFVCTEDQEEKEIRSCFYCIIDYFTVINIYL